MLFDMPEVPVLSRMTEEQVEIAEQFWSALWANYARNKGTTSLPYWADKMNDPLLFNGLLMSWKDMIITHVIPARNWAEVQLNEDYLLTRYSGQELTDYRRVNKFSKYMLNFKESTNPALVKTREGLKKTGLVRKGFMRAANTQYYYDVCMLSAYKDEIIANTNKSMIKMRERMPKLDTDEASYDVISADIVESLASEPELFTQGRSMLDSRGRAIKGSLSCVANPIGYKAFRSLLTIPE